MAESLFDEYGARKYLVPREREAFVKTALQAEAELAAFSLTLAFTGARISEVLAIGPASLDIGHEAIVFQTLKQRGKRRFRHIAVPRFLLDLLSALDGAGDGRMWTFRRTTGWSRVKSLMRKAGIGEAQCKPKALRHAFAIDAVLNGVPLNVVQRWMGHARIETTAIYTCVLGEEERILAQRTWKSLISLLPSRPPPSSERCQKGALKE